MKPHTIDELERENASLRARLLTLEQALRVIQQAMRGDEQAQCWTIRKWLDERDIFNGDIQGRDRLVYEACKAALAASRGREPEEPDVVFVASRWASENDGGWGVYRSRKDENGGRSGGIVEHCADEVTAQWRAAQMQLEWERGREPERT